MARGYDLKDSKLFSESQIRKLLECAKDATYLINRGYRSESAIRFVAGHYQCPARQILMLSRALCSDHSLALKRSKELHYSQMSGKRLYIDGFNVIISLEILFAGGTLFIGRDGCVKDIAGMRGSYHVIEETQKAIELIAQISHELNLSDIIFYLDNPISNSGRLKTRILENMNSFKCPVQVELMHNPDVNLYHKSVVASADGIVLENCQSWFNLVGYCITKFNKTAVVADFS